MFAVRNPQVQLPKEKYNANAPESPMLIFVANYSDPATFFVMQYLIPELKETYKLYYDQNTPVTVDQMIKNLENLEQKYSSLIAEMKDLGLENLDGKDLDSYFLYKYCAISTSTPYETKQKWLIETLSGARDGQAYRKSYDELTNTFIGHQSRVEYLAFLRLLISQELEYKGIDTKFKGNIYEKETEYQFASRNHAMAKHYASATKPVFGMLGLVHVKGLQEELLAKVSRYDALKRFKFINLHSQAPMEALLKVDEIGDREKGEMKKAIALEQSMRDGTHGLRLPISSIDCSDMRTKAGMVRIIEEIQEISRPASEMTHKL